MRFWFRAALAAMVIGHSGLAMADGNGDFVECVAAFLQEDDDKALALCTLALKSGDLSHQQTVNALTTRGALYVSKGDYDKAIQDLDEAIRLKPGEASAYNNRGIAYAGKGEYDRAIQDFDQAILLKPDDGAAYTGRASTYANKGKYDLAIQGYDQAIRLSPNSTYVSLSRAKLLFELARFSDAVDALEELVDAHPELAEGALWLSLAQRRAGDGADDALKAHEEALDLGEWPGAVVRLYLGQISRDAVQAATHDPDEATARLRSCDAAFYIAELDLISGQIESAKPGFQHVIDICPKSYTVSRIAKAELGRL
ncbi:tetratricopeptide repeat protein [Dongia sp.]|uniref:tetratricopeptide repeat protein n=1 Tax=Dongia sp. TaxID=1977262 RepID=UPI00375238C0